MRWSGYRPRRRQVRRMTCVQMQRGVRVRLELCMDLSSGPPFSREDAPGT
jgi:hypothetical protein